MRGLVVVLLAVSAAGGDARRRERAGKPRAYAKPTKEKEKLYADAERAGALRPAVKFQLSDAASTADEKVALARKVGAAMGCDDVAPIFRHAGKHQRRLAAHGLDRWFRARCAAGGAAAALKFAAEAGHLERAVASLEPAAEYRLLGRESNDPMLGEQKHYAAINLYDAWAEEVGSPDVVVQVVDTGIDVTHPDLARNIWTNPGEICGNGVDDDDNGYVDDCHGWNFADDHNGHVGDGSHGSHCAGTIAADTHNRVGVAGVAGGWKGKDGAKLMIAVVFGQSNVDGFAEALVYGANNGARISSNSWGYTSPGVFDPDILDAIDYFNEAPAFAHDGVVVVAAGNDGSDANYYPGFYDGSNHATSDGAVAVAATFQTNGTRTAWSNYGVWVDIAAPGERVLSTVTVGDGSYDTYDGTSMSAPHVAGVFALMLSANPSMTRADLLRCAYLTGADGPGPDAATRAPPPPRGRPRAPRPTDRAGRSYDHGGSYDYGGSYSYGDCDCGDDDRWDDDWDGGYYGGYYDDYWDDDYVAPDCGGRCIGAGLVDAAAAVECAKNGAPSPAPTFTLAPTTPRPSAEPTTAAPSTARPSAAPTVTASPTAACACDQTLELVLLTDDFPAETSWALAMAREGASPACDDASAEGGGYDRPRHEYRDVVSEKICAGQAYTFALHDTFGDGICCGYGAGAYELLLEDATLSAGTYTDSPHAIDFVAALPPTAAPSAAPTLRPTFRSPAAVGAVEMSAGFGSLVLRWAPGAVKSGHDPAPNFAVQYERVDAEAAEGRACKDTRPPEFDKSCRKMRDAIAADRKNCCKKNRKWTKKGYCEQTCFDLGKKYAYSECVEELDDGGWVDATPDAGVALEVKHDGFAYYVLAAEDLAACGADAGDAVALRVRAVAADGATSKWTKATAALPCAP